MKICFCNILYSKPAERGGLGSHIHDLSVEISQRGHEVTIITSGQKKEFLENGVRILQIGKVDRFSTRWQLLNPVYILQRLRYMVKLALLVHKERFDLVEAADGGAEHFFLAIFRPCTIVTKLHGSFRHIYKNSLLTPIIEAMESFSAARSDGLYASSFAYARSISGEYGIDLQKIKIIPYGIRVQELCSERANLARVEGKDPARVLLSVGTSAVRKGAPIFLNAAARLKKIQFILECSDKNFLRQTDIPGNVSVLENLPRSRFYSILSDADVVVFPSQFESFSITAYEAMLLGKIILVSTAIPMEGTATRYPRCLVIEKNDDETLARMIGDVVEQKIPFRPLDPSIVEAMQREYDIRTVAESTLTYYEQIHAARSLGALSPTVGAHGVRPL